MFLKYSHLKTWPWKSKVKVIGKVKGQGHIDALLFYITPPVPTIPNVWPIKSLTEKKTSEIKKMKKKCYQNLSPFKFNKVRLNMTRIHLPSFKVMQSHPVYFLKPILFVPNTYGSALNGSDIRRKKSFWQWTRTWWRQAENIKSPRPRTLN